MTDDNEVSDGTAGSHGEPLGPADPPGAWWDHCFEVTEAHLAQCVEMVDQLTLNLGALFMLRHLRANLDLRGMFDGNIKDLDNYLAGAYASFTKTQRDIAQMTPEEFAEAMKAQEAQNAN